MLASYVITEFTYISLFIADHVTSNPAVEVTYAKWLFTLDSGIGYIWEGFAYWSGIVLMVALTVMFICSQSFVRRSGHFQV